MASPWNTLSKRPPICKAAMTTIGKKWLMALSGLALVGFVITHLLGNLTLLEPSGVWFNQYAYKLSELGIALILAEVGLGSFFLLHIVTAIDLTRKNKSARSTKYLNHQSKGGPSKMNPTSKNMIVTGMLLLIFLIVHICQFKFGPSIEEGYVTELAGKNVRDLHRLVVETFKNPLYTAYYVAMMVLLGAHLKHGFWSAFQSLGLLFPRVSKSIYCLGWMVAAGLSFGFLMIPILLMLGLGN